MIFVLPLIALAGIAIAADDANPWATYPSVPKTATINGFADPVYDDLPSCAQPCVKRSVSSTPCPYWDTGCLCVMTTWNSAVTECFAENCKGEDAQKALDVSNAVCKRVGVWEPYWIINLAASAAIESAIGEKAQATNADDTPTTPAAAEAQPTQETTTTEGDVTSATSAAAPETTANPTTAAAAAEDGDSFASPETSSAISSPSSAAPSTDSSEDSGVSPSARSSAAAVSSSAPAVTSFEGAANGMTPAIAIGVAAGLAMIL